MSGTGPPPDAPGPDRVGAADRGVRGRSPRRGDRGPCGGGGGRTSRTRTAAAIVLAVFVALVDRGALRRPARPRPGRQSDGGRRRLRAAARARARGARRARRRPPRRPLPDRRPRPLPGRAARPGGRGDRIDGPGGGLGPARRRVDRLRRAGLLRGRVRAVRARHRGGGGPAADVRVGVAPARPRALAPHDAGRERGAPPGGGVDPRRPGPGADRPRHDPVGRAQRGRERAWRGGGRADRRGARARHAQPARAARRDRRPRPLRVPGDQLRHRDRELPAGLAAPLRLRGGAGDRAHRPAARDAGRPVPDRAGGRGERRPPRGGAGGVDLAPDGRLTGGAARGRRRPRLRRNRPARCRRARAPRPREHARARGADGRHARDRVVGARDAGAGPGAARAPSRRSD